jgi:hypothetical protein
VRGVNRDTVIAIVLLLFCGVGYYETLQIRKTSYGSMGSEVWPQAILAILTVLTLIYLAQSVRSTTGVRLGGGDGLRGFVIKYQNALWCYALFTVFVYSLPTLGMLLAGIAFVFLTLTAVGNRDPRSLALHVAVAVGAVGFMWGIFTFALRVILPEGEILGVW